MAPRSKLTYHEKGHILRQFSGHAAMSARALADRYGVNKAVFTNILEEKRTNCTSSSDITFDFFKTTSANLEVKEEAVSSEEEVGVSLKEKDDASLAKEKWVNASLEGEEEDKEMKKEPVSLVQEEAGIPAVHEQDTKSAGQDSKLTERLKEISPNDSLAPPLTHEAFSEAPDEHSHSRQELFTALLTLQQVVEYNPMPRWFTFVFDSLLPGSSLMEDAWPGALWGRRSTVSLRRLRIYCRQCWWCVGHCTATNTCPRGSPLPSAVCFRNTKTEEDTHSMEFQSAIRPSDGLGFKATMTSV
ncbi:uncharacterized protein LOC123519657 [Portunus trituberculatus]|uniref:uncharacterized protein LOC123519657 n=1 Tax=Portunus trituberculatus TaxID=210409 RepID=UPI001E1D1D0A|nr:uncharacterized protein LOC123519657 [Portunus trituberculatus]XP_045137067.1 uncharacterized protein LOC123519657 [Portunus trituberculatus]XP_045137068.1 uncharacterized protein LOC123519657 [Portunus trituberculatus]XP_045137069.1 uncharacterized protein LOC123519657 [Portunus trituberculatus]